MEGIVATSYGAGDKFYIDPMKLLPLARFLPQPKYVSFQLIVILDLVLSCLWFLRFEFTGEHKVVEEEVVVGVEEEVGVGVVVDSVAEVLREAAEVVAFVVVVDVVVGSVGGVGDFDVSFILCSSLIHCSFDFFSWVSVYDISDLSFGKWCLTI